MTRVPVVSSNVHSVGYADGTLEVEFLGGVYQYRDVPADLHARLLAAPSVGRFFEQHVKHVYLAVKLSQEEQTP